MGVRGAPQIVAHAGQPLRFAGWWTYKRAPTSRSRCRLAAKNRPSRRPVLSFSSRACQRSALEPWRSRMPVTSAEIAALPARKSRPVKSTGRRSFPSEDPSSIPSRDESKLLRSSIGQSQLDSCRPADAIDPAVLPCYAGFTFAVRPCCFTCSTRVVIEVLWLAPGTFTMPVATGFRSMSLHVARSDSFSRIATLLKRPPKNAP